jgi:hypothetical protein
VVEPTASDQPGERHKLALVECLSGADYADRPLAFTWEGRRWEIAEILERWRGPGEKGFRIKTTEGQVFELTYREIPDDWRVRPY